MEAYTCLYQERDGDEDGKDEHPAQSIEVKCSAPRFIHKRDGYQSHYNLNGERRRE